MKRPPIISLFYSFLTSLYITYMFFIFILMEGNPMNWTLFDRQLFSIISFFGSLIIFPFYHITNGQQKIPPNINGSKF